MNKKDLEGWFLMELNMEEVVGKDIPPQSEEEEIKDLIKAEFPQGIEKRMIKQIKEKWKKIKKGDKNITKETPYWEIKIED